MRLSPFRLAVLIETVALAAAHAAPDYQQGSVKRPDGATIAYYVRGGAGPNLLLIPGSWDDRQVFDRFVDRLPRHVRAIVVELRGHGGSQPATLAASMSGFAEDVLHVADALGLGRFYVGGHSIGGMLAIEIAGRRPEQVAGAVSMEGWTHHLVAKEAFAGGPASTMTAAQQRTRARLSEAEIAAFASVWRQWDGLPILQSTTAPILELWGDRGRTRPSHEQMRIPRRDNIELVWIAGASHALPIQAPEELASHTARFIESNEARHMLAVPDHLLQGH